MQVTFEIPDTFATNLIAAGKNPSRIALEALAIEGYCHRQLSESAIRQMLGFENRSEVHAFLADNDVPFNYSIEDETIGTR